MIWNANSGGDAYELTGSAEDDLERFVGQRVAISGTRKEAEIDVETGQPTGGRQAGDDLKLFEVEVASFRALAEPVQTYTAARADEPPRSEDPQGSGSPVAESPAVDDRVVNDAADDLPRTASPLALTGLLGLLSFAGVAGLRNLRRRDWL